MTIPDKVDPSLFLNEAEWDLWVAICACHPKEDPGPKPEGLVRGKELAQKAGGV